MTAGAWKQSDFPPPVRAVEIPKPHDRGVRLLGVPTVADRVAQTVVARHLEERAEPRFHPDSYGYRPNKAAWEAALGPQEVRIFGTAADTRLAAPCDNSQNHSSDAPTLKTATR